MKISSRLSWNALTVLVGLTLTYAPAAGQWSQEQGHSIGKITTQGNLIVMELDEGALGKANLFDLERRTLRFTPERQGYRAQNLPLRWDGEFGSEITDGHVALHHFAFPFSGQKWDALFVEATGAITFGSAQTNGRSPEGRRSDGFPMGRFDELGEAAGNIINTVPGISVFLKPRMSGHRFVRELPDRAIITWDLTEPWGGIQDFTWKPTVNRFQAVLFQDGSIEMSYQQLAARDAIVGLYPLVNTGKETALAVLPGEPNPAAMPSQDIKNLKLSVVDGIFLEGTFETRGPALTEGDPALAGLTYRVYWNAENPAANAEKSENRVLWTVRGVSRPGRNGASGSGSRYIAFGSGLSREVKVTGNTISIRGSLPNAFKNARQLYVSAEATSGNPGQVVGRVPPKPVSLSGVRSPEIDLSSVSLKDGPFTVAYESFHYLKLPNPRDLTCTVINALGDHYDLLAYYSDFRIDNQEAGTPSNGPLGGKVTGIGQTERGLESYCSAGRFQWQFIQPVYVGSNQMQERPPAGENTNNSRDVDFYDHQLGERSPDGRMPAYNYALSQIGHEMGHRWSAFVSAKVGDETILLGPTHWARGLQAPVPFPFQRPVEASAMGGGVWQDNFDGTYTQLDDDYYVPATGYSYLDLYLMGLIAPAEVPDFFILRNLVAAGKDAHGRPIFKADRVKVTIDDVISVEGPRQPTVDQSQKKFNTGMVVVIEHGKQPSAELIDRTNAISQAWIDYWTTVTGHRSSMTTNVQ